MTDYKEIYEIAAKAIAAGKYKLVYEKAGKFYGSAFRVPTDSDCLIAAKQVMETFVEVADTVQEPMAVESETENAEPEAAVAAEEETKEEPEKVEPAKRARRAAKEAEAVVVEEE